MSRSGEAEDGEDPDLGGDGVPDEEGKQDTAARIASHALVSPSSITEQS